MCQSEVLKVLQDKQALVTAPAPFPQSAQYKTACEEEPEEHDPETEKPRKKGKSKKAKGKRRCPAQVAKASHADPKADEPVVVVPVKPATPDETYSPSRYAELRKHFVSEKMATGLSWKIAQGEWNKSDLKRQLLSSVDLPELKRRRFVSKECTKNPWQAS